MTDKTSKNKAETPETLAGTTDTVRDGEPKSRTLPQADALKARFKAGSIPLQTDFADLIDLANIGRRAVGREEGQAGPAYGFTLSSEGRLELKPNAAKGVTVDQDGIAVIPGKGIQVDSEGINVKIHPNSSGLDCNAKGLLVKPGKGIKVDNNGVYLPLGWGLKHGGEGLDVLCKENGGLNANKDGTRVISGNGIAVNSSGVNVKLAKGTHTNGGEGQGINGITSGNAGGLSLSGEGLSVDAGSGIQINPQGVSLKLANNSGLSADETNGLRITPGSGIKVDSDGVKVKIHPDNSAIGCNSSGLWVKAGSGIKVDSDGVNVKVYPNTSGLACTSQGVWVKTGRGIGVDSDGVKLSEDSWIRIFCQMHKADFYAVDEHFLVTVEISRLGDITFIHVKYISRGVYFVDRHYMPMFRGLDRLNKNALSEAFLFELSDLSYNDGGANRLVLSSSTWRLFDDKSVVMSLMEKAHLELTYLIPDYIGIHDLKVKTKFKAVN